MNKKITAVLICVCVFFGAARAFAKQANENNDFTGDIFNKNSAAYKLMHENFNNSVTKWLNKKIAVIENEKTGDDAKKAAERRAKETFEFSVAVSGVTADIIEHKFINVKDLEITQSLISHADDCFVLVLRADNLYCPSKINIHVVNLCKVHPDLRAVFSINENNKLLVHFDRVYPRHIYGDKRIRFIDPVEIGRVFF